MSNSSSGTSGGMGLGMVLFLIFMVLKLCEVIIWSWWWVTCPLWIPACLLVGWFVVVLLIALITFLILWACKT